MFDSPTQPSILEWLDLYPELLSAAGRRPDLGAAQPAAGPGDATLGDDMAVAVISAQAVLPWAGALLFHQAAPMSPPPALGAASHIYRAADKGGTQHDALSHIAGHSVGGFGW